MSYSDYPPPLPPALPRPSHNRTLSNLSTSSTSSHPNTFSPTRPKLKLNDYVMSNSNGSGSNNSASPSRPISPEQMNGYRSTSPSSNRSRQQSQVSVLSSDSTQSNSSRPYGSPSQIIKTLPFSSPHSRFNSVSSVGSGSRQQQQQNQTYGGVLNELGSMESSPFRRDMAQLPSPPNTLDGTSNGTSNGLRSSKGDDAYGGINRDYDTTLETPIPWTPTRKRTFPLPSEEGMLDSTRSSNEKPLPSVILDYGGDPHSSERRSNSISVSPSSSSQTLHHRRSSSNLRKAKLPTLDLSGSLFNASASSSGSGPLSTALPSSIASSAATSPGSNQLTPESEHRSLRLSHSFGSATTARGGDDSFEGEDGEARRLRRSKRAAEVKEKNQKVSSIFELSEFVRYRILISCFLLLDTGLNQCSEISATTTKPSNHFTFIISFFIVTCR